MKTPLGRKNGRRAHMDRMAALVRKLDAIPTTIRSPPAPLETPEQIAACVAPYLAEGMTTDELIERMAAACIRDAGKIGKLVGKQYAATATLEKLAALLAPYRQHDPPLSVAVVLALLARDRSTLH